MRVQTVFGCASFAMAILLALCGKAQEACTACENRGGKSLIRFSAAELAKDIAELVATSQSPGTRGFLQEEMLSAPGDREAGHWRSNSVAWSPSGRHVAAAGRVGLIRLWDAQTKNLEAEAARHSGVVFSVAWSPDGKRLVSGGQDKTVRIWEWDVGEPLTQFAILSGHSAEVLSVAWSPDGKRLASAGKDQSIRLWYAGDSSRGPVLGGHKGPVHSVRWSPDGSRLASCGEDRTIRVWDAALEQEQVTLKGHLDKVWEVAWSPDGKRLASASEDRTIRLWAVATGQEELVLKGHSGGVAFVSWSPDGSRLISVGDATVRVWAAASGKEIGMLLAHPRVKTPGWIPFTYESSGLLEASWSPDGTRVAVAGEWTLIRRLPNTMLPR